MARDMNPHAGEEILRDALLGRISARDPDLLDPAAIAVLKGQINAVDTDQPPYLLLATRYALGRILELEVERCKREQPILLPAGTLQNMQVQMVTTGGTATPPSLELRLDEKIDANSWRVVAATDGRVFGKAVKGEIDPYSGLRPPWFIAADGWMVKRAEELEAIAWLLRTAPELQP